MAKIRVLASIVFGVAVLIGIAPSAQAASNWSAVTDLSATGRNVTNPQLALSGDGTAAIAIWQRGTAIQASTAKVNGNKATWSAVGDVSAIDKAVDRPQVAISNDGAKAIAVWQRSNGTNTIIQAATATITANTATWSSVSDLSATLQSATDAQVALSSDGTKAAVVWQRSNGANTIIQAKTATITANSATWSAVANLSASGQSAGNPQIAVSENSSKAIAVWFRMNDLGTPGIQAKTATISSNSATWSAAANLSADTSWASNPQVALSTDGTKSTVGWVGRNAGGHDVIQTASATISSNTATWSSVSDLSDASTNAISPQLAMSGDGTKATIIWALNTLKSVVREASATISDNTATWSAPREVSATDQATGNPQIALSTDGTRSTALWRRLNGTNYIAQSTSAMMFVPGAPTLDFTGDTLSISPSADTGGSPLTSYAILYNTQTRIDTNKAWATWATWWPLGTTSIDLGTYRTAAACTPVAATATPAGKCYRAIGEHTPGGTFSYQVAAVNANGRGAWTTQSITRPTP